MKIFISWSGKQSQAVAKALGEWLPMVVPGSQPSIFGAELTAGISWYHSLMEQLESMEFCIICLTPDNVRSPWLYFEAGAIAASNRNAKVCGFLTGINPSQISGPLDQFQCVQSDVDGVLSLLKAIYDAFLNGAYDEHQVTSVFTANWPRLRENLKEALLLYDPRFSTAEVETEQPKSNYKLSDEAHQLVVEAAADKNGLILMARTMSGLILQTNDRQLSERQDPRSEAKWQRAIRELVQQGLIEGRGNKGEVFGVTAEGFRVADELKAKPI